jgi:type IV secretory pathway component VirB8
MFHVFLQFNNFCYVGSFDIIIIIIIAFLLPVNSVKDVCVVLNNPVNLDITTKLENSV